MTEQPVSASLTVRVLRWAWLVLTAVVCAGLVAGILSDVRSPALPLLLVVWVLLGALLASDPVVDRLAARTRGLVRRLVGRG